MDKSPDKIEEKEQQDGQEEGGKKKPVKKEQVYTGFASHGKNENADVDGAS
jgi:hypothetical protein